MSCIHTKIKKLNAGRLLQGQGATYSSPRNISLAHGKDSVTMDSLVVLHSPQLKGSIRIGIEWPC
jgi:hypothetical protein